MCRIPDIGETTPILNNIKYKNINSEATGSEATPARHRPRGRWGEPRPAAPRGRGWLPAVPRRFRASASPLRGTLRAAGNRRRRRSTSASRALARFYHRSRSHSHSRSHSRVRSRSHSLTCGTYPRSALLAASKPSMTRWHLEGHSSCNMALSRRLRPS
jgi:hypothetical protein